MTTDTLTSRRSRAIGLTALLLVVLAATGWWLRSRHFEATDDAQIDGHFHAISARTSGTVVRIGADVQNNHFVRAGTLLLELDPADVEVELDQARARMATKEAAARAAALSVPIVQASAFSRLTVAREGQDEAAANVAVEEANLVAAQHRVEQDLVNAERTERDRVRYLALVEKHEISRSEYDARDSEAQMAAATLAADRATVVAAQSKIAQARKRVAQRQSDVQDALTAPNQLSSAEARSAAAAAEVEQARADVRSAELNLQYTKIYAPTSGIIGRKTVEIGHRIQPGQSLLIIVPMDDIWVTANFKETQLKTMRPGQPVNIHVDAFDRDYSGVVDEMAGAAGTLFSLLPPENASGNFVKVVQRLPVRIRLHGDQDAEHRLRPGMSVEARVRVN
jgi:membrane fusion protein (multidrug efflux system)